MEHPDTDALARHALESGPSDVDVDQHLAACPTCRAEVEDLRELADLARAIRSERLEPPPPHVWQGVVDELGLDVRRTRRSRALAWAAAAAVVGLGLGSATTWAVLRQDDPAPTTAEVLRSADLEPVTSAAGASGTARLVEGRGGRWSVEVSAPDLRSARGHFEVWMIKPGTDRMISLGVLDNVTAGDFALPATALADGYTLVDVSDEPDDGLPTHSGDSVLRGDLSG